MLAANFGQGTLARLGDNIAEVFLIQKGTSAVLPQAEMYILLGADGCANALAERVCTAHIASVGIRVNINLPIDTAGMLTCAANAMEF